MSDRPGGRTRYREYYGDRKERPERSIEVVIKGEGQTKLKRYAALGVPEVWFWQRGQLMVYQLMGASYQRVEASQFAPGIDLTALAECASIESRAQAVSAFRARA